MKRYFCRAMVVALGLLAPQGVSAQLFINELFLDPPGSSADATHEYVELRGPSGMSLANHYLIFLENEDTPTHNGAAGTVDMIFDLGAYSLGANGFLTIRQKDNPLSSYGDYTPDPGATNLQNTGTGVGFGSGAGSTVGASNQNGATSDGRMENSGFTAMLIRNDGDPVTNKPALGFDLDVGNDGLDVPTGRVGWSILDSIGLFAEINEAWDPDFLIPLGRTYAQINFGPENSENTPGFVNANIEPGAIYVGLGYEIELLARWGNSTGQTEADWHATNVTDNALSGFIPGSSGFRQSVGDPHPTGPIESNRGVVYGTNLTNTLGSPNLGLSAIPGDFDGDGDVDGDDLTDEWVVRFGNDLEGEDFLLWQRNLGLPAVPAAAPTVGAVPEPTTALLLGVALAGLAATYRASISRPASIS